jgi:hypothetical protein
MLRLVALVLGATLVAVSADQRTPAKASAPEQTTVDARTTETSHLKLTTSTSALNASPRALFVDVAPKPKMHVYAPGQDGYITVALSVEPGSTLTAAGPPRFPKAEKLFFKPLNETQLVYSKPFRITQDVKQVTSPGDSASGPLIIKGSLRYQACDDRVCYLPQTVPLEWTVKR